MTLRLKCDAGASSAAFESFLSASEFRVKIHMPVEGFAHVGGLA